MAHHPRLKSLPNVKHIKAFSKYLRGIEGSLEKLGNPDYEVEVISQPSKSLFRRLVLNQGFKDFVEAMVIKTEMNECLVEILVPISRNKVKMPYSILVELPVPMSGHAEYRKGAIGTKWHYEPKNKSRLSDLKRTVPKAKMKQQHGNLFYLIKVGHSLAAAENGHTLWQVDSGYEGSSLTGGYRPKVFRYLEAIPKIKGMLENWNNH